MKYIYCQVFMLRAGYPTLIPSRRGYLDLFMAQDQRTVFTHPLSLQQTHKQSDLHVYVSD